MSIVRWDPFAEVDSFFNRLVPAAYLSWPRAAQPGTHKKLDWSPATDISETEKEYVIRAELPAVKKEDVQVTFDDGVITIKGERRQQQEDKTEKLHRVETFYGSFERRFALPDHVNSDAIHCESKDGILTVRVPKVELVKTKPKQITVQ